ncbi:hypothetical protein BDV35DRAFT_387873 [Aspergillus flavus]|uniref:Unnamed protein product n=3 Tax=Aspergillus subgen. Circumdati TaxID=2720871 RepID=A0A1S9DPY7_ASPOZ|nr:hypothetical protein BDV35DRAFT_387873 [Aspergillus flavus]OOO11139.1 hypothetical protein OAory_01076090 [Aspergillus oryzae]GMG29968.1 unnamed protein product [Aspergillus oryzae]GMG43540.1 unnamed protein product [Aspergillus oryzae var. brunneus]
MDIDPPTAARAWVGRSSTIAGSMAQDESFNEVSSQCQQLLDRLQQVIQRPVPCAFKTLQVFAHGERLEKFILLDFCMHAWSAGIRTFRHLDYSSDKGTVEVEWHWQPARTVDDRVAVHAVPPSSRNVD